MSEVPREYRDEYLVRSYEVEPDGRLRLVVLLRMLQEAAWQHAHLLGKGFAERADGAYFWVLARLRLRMTRYPRWGERFSVRTFPVGTDRLLALREFSMHDSSGDVVGRAQTGWLIIDGGRGRPVRPQPIVADLPLSEPEYANDPGRIVPPESPRTVGPFPVQYHDIDQYRHVNNASYLEWVIDALDPGRAMTAQIEELAVDFVKETLLGDTYRVQLSCDESTDRFQILRGSDGAACARGFLRWRSEGVDHASGRG